MGLGYFKGGEWVQTAPTVKYDSGTSLMGYGGGGATYRLPEGNTHGSGIFAHGSFLCGGVTCWVQTASSSGGLGRMAIYSGDGTNTPKTLLHDTGTFSVETAGEKTVSISPAITIPFGWVWVFYAQQGGAATRAVLRVTSTFYNAAVYDPVINGSSNTGFLANGITGAFPSSISPIRSTLAIAAKLEVA